MNSFQYRKFKRSQPSKFFPTSLQTYHFRSLSDECKLIETAIIINCIKKPILWKLLNMFMLLFIKIPIKYGKIEIYTQLFYCVGTTSYWHIYNYIHQYTEDI